MNMHCTIWVQFGTRY